MPRIEDNYLARLIGLDHRAAVFVRIDFDTPLYVNDQLRSYTYNGNEYIGVGVLGSISEMEENNELTPSRLKLGLTGIPTSLLDILTTTNYQNRNVYIYYAFLDEDDVIIREPVTMFRGVTGNVEIQQGETASINLEVINQFASWRKVVGWRYNNQTQQRLYPGDTSLQYVYAAQKGVVWRGVAD